MNRDLAKARTYAEHLKSLRSRRENAWRDLSQWICPWRGIFNDELADRYERDELTRFTAAASSAVLRAASGMTSGMTPRNISWFKPCFTEAALMEASGARYWCDILDTRIKDCLAEGGFYQAIQNFNLDLLWSGCGLIYTERGRDCPLRYESVQVGTFCVAVDPENRLSAVLRELEMTAHEAASAFGEDRLATPTRKLLAREPFRPVRITHLVRPARGRQPWESLWWEADGTNFLRKASFDEMPYFYTVWNEGATVYGTGPGDECLADARQMDLLERNKLAGLAKLINPPLKASPSLKDVIDMEPGAINAMTTSEFVEPVFNVAPFATAFRCLQEEIAAVARRLETGLMASIFTSIPLDQRPRDMSATEFLERKREALQQLGPVISAYEPSVLTPLLYRTAHTLDRDRQLPPLPRSLDGLKPLMKMDFISPMANALRQTGAETARAFFQDTAVVFEATRKPEVFDKIDLDQLIDELATGLGAPGSIVRSDEDVARIREQRAAREQQAQQQQLQLAQMELAAKTPQPSPEQQEMEKARVEEQNLAQLASLLGEDM